jgi:A/G-specific adenine glycosylase
MDPERTEAAEYFAARLLDWYERNKRDLPWRRDRDPYRIWVSEVMLQQTRVDTVIPYYERFMRRFPTIRHLAEAPEEEVLKLWEGLGYYSRARNLQAGARQVVERHGGVVPDDRAALSALKGIGPYTAGAILSIAYGKPEPAVDGNVMRVMSRYFLLADDVAKPSARARIERLAASIIPEGRAGDFNQAVMELGALVCTPKSPGCLLCPVLAHCAGRAAGRERELPVKSKAKPPRPEARMAALVEGRGRHAGKVLVRRRPEGGLLARMWELPHVPAPVSAGGGGAARAESSADAGGAAADSWFAGDAAAAAVPEADGAATAPFDAAGTGAFDSLSRGLAEEAGLLVRPVRHWTKAEHVFSHIRWQVDVYLAEFGFFLEAGRGAHASSDDPIGSGAEAPPIEASGGATIAAEAGDPYAGETYAAAPDSDEPPAGWLWIGPEDMASLAFPNVFLKILNDYFAKRA